MDQLWNPDRVRSVASVLTRYGAVLANGDRIQTGIEGDVAYRGGDVGTVTQLNRSDDGRVTFVAQFDEGGSRELTNYGILPEQTWEVLPNYLPVMASRLQAEGAAFRGPYAPSSVAADATDGNDGASATSSPPDGFSIDAEGLVVHNAGGEVGRVVAGFKGPDGATLYMQDGSMRSAPELPGYVTEAEFPMQYRGGDWQASEPTPLAGEAAPTFGGAGPPTLEDVVSSLHELQRRFDAFEEETTTFRQASALTTRHLVSDLMNVSHQKPVEFAGVYADRYDAARHRGDVSDDAPSQKIAGDGSTDLSEDGPRRVS